MCEFYVCALTVYVCVFTASAMYSPCLFEYSRSESSSVVDGGDVDDGFVEAVVVSLEELSGLDDLVSAPAKPTAPTPSRRGAELVDFVDGTTVAVNGAVNKARLPNDAVASTASAFHFHRSGE